MAGIVERLKSLGPGVLISIALHALAVVVLTLLYLRDSRCGEVDPEGGFRADLRQWEPPPPPEPIELVIMRTGIPLNATVEVVPDHGPHDAVLAGSITEEGTADVTESVADGSAVADGVGDGDLLTGSLLGDRSGKNGSPIGVGGGGRRPGARSGHLGGRGGDHVGRRPDQATQATEAAVLYGLTWLARHQQPDGSWDAVRYQDRCLDGSCAGPGNPRHSDGLTGLALLAFLGAGYSHQSRQFVQAPGTEQRLVLGDVVRRGLTDLVERQQPDGSFGADPFLYNQAICAMALCEGYALTGARYLKEPAQRAIGFLTAAQNADPAGTGSLGWRYTPRAGSSDTSVTGWCVMAMKSAELAGLAVDRTTLEGGLKWVKLCTGAEQRTGYLSAGDAGQKVENPEELGRFEHHESMTAVGMLVRTFTSFDWRDPAMEQGARALVADLPTWEPQPKRDYYYWYYASLALNQYSGPDSPNPNKTYWSKWNEKLVQALVGHQENVAPGQTPPSYAAIVAAAGDRGCRTGSFAPSDRFGYAGRIYATAINVLTLEVYYRFENAFGAAPAARSGRGQNAPRPWVGR